MFLGTTRKSTSINLDIFQKLVSYPISSFLVWVVSGNSTASGMASTLKVALALLKGKGLLGSLITFNIGLGNAF